MTAITSQSKMENQTQTETQNEQNSTNKQAKIQKMLETSKQFAEDTKQTISFEPNVPKIVLFPHDFYLDHDDLIDEQIAVHHKSNSEAAEYAEKHYRVRNKLEVDPNDSSRTWGSTIYRGVKLPDSSFPDLSREIRLTSKKAIEAVNNELARVSMLTDGDILLTILKKQGSTKFQTSWEVTGQPAQHR